MKANSGSDSDSGRSGSNGSGRSGRNGRSGSGSSTLMLGVPVWNLNRTVTLLLQLLQHREMRLFSNSLFCNMKP
jgi:hypothetical protein